MEINGVTIQMLPAASGDCIYLEFPDPDFRILIDGGYAKTYHKYLKKFLLKLAAEGKRLNLIVVTHIDDDHIGCCSDMVKYWKESKFDFQFTFSKWHMKMMIRAIASFGRNGWKGVNPVQSKKLCTLLKEFYDEGIYSWEVEAMFLADEKVPAFMNEMLELMYETESDMVFSATMAVEKCLETIMDQQLKENTLLELFNLIKARKEPGLEYFLMIIHNIFYRTNSRFPSKIMKGVSQVLRLVEKYTRINFQISTQEEFKENIKVRKQCATLAFLVYRFENTFYEGQHCPEVEEWKNICTGEKAENEFAEVKNCWLLPEL